MIFNLPEREGDDAHEASASFKSVKLLLAEAKININIEDETSRIHRTPTYRSYQKNSRPRPIHIGFNSYRVKERVKKELIKFVSSPDQRGRKIFVNDDMSKRVLDQRKAQLTNFKALKE